MTPLTTKRLLIANSILLVFILLFLLFVHYTDFKNKIMSYSSYSYHSANTDDEDKAYNEGQDSKVTDFEGLNSYTIDLPFEIVEIMKTELGSFNWKETFEMEEPEQMYHQTFFAQTFPSGQTGESYFVATFSNSNSNHGHACSGRISLFEFRKKDREWDLISKYPAFGYGDEDAIEPRGFEFLKIGRNNKYAVAVHTGYSGIGGHEMEFKRIYTEVNDSLKLVFDFTSYEYYYDPLPETEYTEGYSEFRILESGKEFFDIETKSEGTEWDDKTKGAVKQFSFNGEEYVENSI